MIVPEEFIIQKFYQHAGYPKYVKSTNTYMGGCPVCREGNSWGRKTRCYYIPKSSSICCHNCGWYSKPIGWIMEVEKITYDQLVKQIESCDYEYGIEEKHETRTQLPQSDLPHDSINLFDRTQLQYYVDDPVVKVAADVIIKRKLNVAANRPKSLYVTLTDPVHKNRLVIPFYDNKKICQFYQSRTLIEGDNKPKYLSKMNSEKTLFNYDQVSSSSEHVFVTEGPIDSFFIRNSVAVAGIQEKSKQTFTTTQKKQLDRLFLTQTVWVLDSQWADQASKMKTETLLRQGACVFLWPRDLGKQCKDINDVCVRFGVNQVSPDFILKHTYCDLKGLVKLKQIK